MPDILQSGWMATFMVLKYLTLLALNYAGNMLIYKVHLADWRTALQVSYQLVTSSVGRGPQHACAYACLCPQASINFASAFRAGQRAQELHAACRLHAGHALRPTSLCLLTGHVTTQCLP